MQFTGDEDHSISLEDAAELTAAYRNSASPEKTLAVYFGKAAILGMLDPKTNCVGIRIYNAIKDGRNTFVIIGVTADGEDKEDGEIAEIGFPCPPYCANSSQLNGTA